jgi:hypothetical protein
MGARIVLDERVTVAEIHHHRRIPTVLKLLVRDIPVASHRNAHPQGERR